MDHRQRLESVLEDIDALRPYLLNGNNDEAAIRGTLRRIVSELEKIKLNPGIPMARFQQVISLFSQLIDTENGTILKRMYEEVSDNDKAQLASHIKERQKLLQNSTQDSARAKLSLIACCEMLGNTPDKEADLTDIGKLLNLLLSEHLKADASLRSELNLLVDAFHSSLKSMHDVIEESGSDSSELQKVQALLSQDLPDDPKAAHAMLQEARNNLLQAGQKIGKATETLRKTMHDNLENMQQLSSKLEQAESMARNDPLTGLANRRKLAEFFEKLDRSTPNSFVMVDIDHFKSFNDTYGHDTGDIILTTLAKILKDSVRLTDLVARLGGEEFCIVFPATQQNVALELGEKLREAVEIYPFDTTQGKLHVTISLGVAEHQANESYASWLKRADKALYRAKAEGRNRIIAA